MHTPPEYKVLYERRKRDNQKSVRECERKVRNAISPIPRQQFNTA